MFFSSKAILAFCFWRLFLHKIKDITLTLNKIPKILLSQSLFLASQSPVLNDQNDSLTYELGQQLQFAKAGQITAIRYYKATSETGTHVGRIWASDGTLLASVTFVDETEAGWQEQQLDTSLAVEASTSYLVSVNVNEYYVATNFNPPQTFARGDISGSSSGFFGETGVYPTASFNNNYFRDVVFETD